MWLDPTSNSREWSGEHGVHGDPSGLDVGSFFFPSRESSSNNEQYSSRRLKITFPTSEDNLPDGRRTLPTLEVGARFQAPKMFSDKVFYYSIQY